jgi:LasA protease
VGQIGTATACGGQATEAHLHFNISYQGNPIAWDGQQLGDWTIYEGTKPYQGYAKKNEVKVSRNQRLYNDGSW